MRISLLTTNANDDQPFPLFQSSQNRQEWLYVTDHCRAIDLLAGEGRIGELYNIGRGVEQIADRILALPGKPESWKTIVPDRPGHDRRYLPESTKIRRELGWGTGSRIEEGMRETVNWYVANEAWWPPLKEEARR